MKNRILAGITAVLMLAMPMAALAAPLGESIQFQSPIQTEYMTIDNVTITRMADTYIMLDVYYTLPDTLSDEAKEALAHVSFCLMADTEGTDYLTDAVERISYAYTAGGESEPLPGGVYYEESQWAGMQALPDTLYIRPAYGDLQNDEPNPQGAVTWGDVIVLTLSDGVRIEVEDYNDVTPPLTDKDAREHING